MTYKEFDNILKTIGLNKKEFAKMVGMSYTSITNWGQKANVPSWVISWLENYIKSSKFDKVKKIFNDEVDIENLKSNDA